MFKKHSSICPTQAGFCAAFTWIPKATHTSGVNTCVNHVKKYNLCILGRKNINSCSFALINGYKFAYICRYKYTRNHIFICHYVRIFYLITSYPVTLPNNSNNNVSYTFIHTHLNRCLDIFICMLFFCYQH